MSGPLVCIKSLPFMIYVPSWVVCPDSESGGSEEPESEVPHQGLTIDESHCPDENSITLKCIDSEENNTIDPDRSNCGVLTLAYPDPPESTSNPSVYEDYIGFSDGNIRLLVRTQSFLLHEHKLEEFSALKEIIKDARQDESELNTDHKPRNTLELTLDEDPEDFANTVKILYLTIYECVSPEDHNEEVLKSTLRLATRLGHPILRLYAIQCLEKRDISAIERIALANDLDIPSWRKDALDVLSARERPITLEEAEYIGMETFVELASLRQTYKLNSKSKAPPNLQRQARQGPAGHQPPTLRTLRRSARVAAGKRRVGPYNKRNVSSR